MVVPVFTQEQFLAFLKEKGFDVVCDDYWDDFDRVLLEKDGETFPLQMRDKYFYPHVVKTCETLGTTAPEDHQKCYDQVMALKKSDK